LLGETSRICSGVQGVRSHAFGFAAATRDNPAQISALSRCASASVCPHAARQAFS
jgi:hypothetical protein